MGCESIGPSEFYRALYEGIGSGFIELRGQIYPEPEDGKLRYRAWFEWPGEVDKIGQAIKPLDGKLNLWYGVGLRKARGVGKKEDVGCITAIHCDIDFKDTPREKALLALKTFTPRASIGVSTGGGFHVYWLLKEPAFEVDYPKVEAINRAVADVLGGDKQASNVAQPLRIVGTQNIKYNPPGKVEVIVFRKDQRCTLEDFEYLPLEIRKGHEELPLPKEGSTKISPESREKIVNIGKLLWVEGHRHETARNLSGYLLKNGVSEDDTLHLIQAICAITGDKEVGNRLETVKDTFKAVRKGRTVSGYTGLEELVHGLPEANQKALEELDKLFHKQYQKKAIRVSKIKKYTYDPPRYDVTMSNGEAEKEYSTRVSLEELTKFRKFKEVFVATHDFFPSSMKQIHWEKSINDVMASPDTFSVHAIDEEVAGVAGEIKAAIHDLMENARPIGKMGDSALQYYPILDEDTNEIIVRVAAVIRYLASQKIDANRAVVIECLRQEGFKTERRTIGNHQARVWIKRDGELPL